MKRYVPFLVVVVTFSSAVFGDISRLVRDLQFLNASLTELQSHLTALPAQLQPEEPSGIGTKGLNGLTQEEIQKAIERKNEGVIDLSGMQLNNIDGLDNFITNILKIDLDSVKRLSLFNNQLTALPVGIFDQLTNLQWLHLSKNQLTALPDGIFDQLTNLESLYLWDNNQLTTLPDGIFDKLPNLNILELWGNNQLTILSDGIFDKLPNLNVLDLANNQLIALPGGIFDQLTNLKLLHLYGNPFTSLPANLFEKNKGVTVTFSLDQKNVIEPIIKNLGNRATSEERTKSGVDRITLSINES